MGLLLTVTNGRTEEERLCRSQLQSNAISAKSENSIVDLGVFFSGLALQIDCIACYCPILWKRSKEHKSLEDFTIFPMLLYNDCGALLSDFTEM